MDDLEKAPWDVMFGGCFLLAFLSLVAATAFIVFALWLTPSMDAVVDG